MKPFLSEDFLLYTETAKALYQAFAKPMPIFDYHCHLPVKEIADNKKFKNLTEIWLHYDHYKWRAMRANGIEERFITGDASDFEKYRAWAATVPKTLRNPLFHWTHMELKAFFGITGLLLNPKAAKDIYDRCTEMLQQDDFTARSLLNKANVKVVCTTDDPTDDLSFHRQIETDQSFSVTVVPTFRPDKASAVEEPEKWNVWVNKLEAAADMSVHDYRSFLDALKNRHDAFHDNGGRSADHGLEVPCAEDFTPREVAGIFDSLRRGKKPTPIEVSKFRYALLIEIARMHAEKNWVQQFHIGPIRNTNSRLLEQIGTDAGGDSIGDVDIAKPMTTLLDYLDRHRQLAKTILYNINPRDNELLASLAGNFQDGSVPGKMQFGAAWWYNDQKEGMERQINALSNIGLLSHFVGMTTDSRSFLSFPRHDYFRRILCNLLGDEIEKGELPNDRELIGEMIKDICYHNAARYFAIK
jgi:glucuronate isomerase